jgi:hypothetical protein
MLEAKALGRAVELRAHLEVRVPSAAPEAEYPAYRREQPTEGELRCELEDAGDE